MGRRLRLKTEPSELLNQLWAEHKALLTAPVEKVDGDFEGIFAAVGHLSKLSSKVHQIRNEIRRLNRSAAAKRSYASRKQRGLIKTAAQKREERQKEREHERWLDSREPESCTCFLGFAPCVWCTRSCDQDEDEEI